MSGPTKKVADMTAKAVKKIDWDGMAKMIVSEEARKEFFNLRRTFEEVNHTLQTKFSMVIDNLYFVFHLAHRFLGFSTDLGSRVFLNFSISRFFFSLVDYCNYFDFQEPVPIDWEKYRKGIGSKFVDMYKEAYDSTFSCLLLSYSHSMLSYL